MKKLRQHKAMSYDIQAARRPVTYLFWLTLTVSIVLQLPRTMTYTEAFILTMIGFLFIGLHWYCKHILAKSALLYFTTQSILLIACTLFAKEYAILLLLSFGSILVIQAFYELPKRAYIAFVCCYFAISGALLRHMYTAEYFAFFVLIIVLMFILVYFVLVIFHEKELEKRELERANKKIEQLTRQNERQRMARDLHDSLIQRLIGANLKLDVVEAHLKKGNYDKAEAVTMLAKEQVSASIQEARQVVDDLRLSVHHLPFDERVLEEVQQLAFTFSLPISVHVDVEQAVAQSNVEHVIAIMKEAITNVHKHANATAVQVRAIEKGNMCHIVIRDNGVGLRKQQKQAGHYGFVGMKERAAILQGQLYVTSKKGVEVRVIFPLEKEE